MFLSFRLLHTLLFSRMLIFTKLSCFLFLTLFKFICPFKYPVFHIIMIDVIGKSFFRSDFIFIDRLDCCGILKL